MNSIYFLVGEDGHHLYNRIMNSEDAMRRILLKNRGAYGVRYDFDKNGEAVIIRGYYYISVDMALIYVNGIAPWEV